MVHPVANLWQYPFGQVNILNWELERFARKAESTFWGRFRCNELEHYLAFFAGLRFF